MSGALSSLVGVMVAAVIPMEALLFVAGDEQQNDTDCAQAVVESIAAQFWHHPVAAPRDSQTDSDSETEDFSLSVAEIHELLSANQIPNRAFWMSWEEVVAITATHGPVIVHFSEPTGHYAVAVGGVRREAARADIGSAEHRASGGGTASAIQRQGRAHPFPIHHLLVADPARGDIIVSKAWWDRHASGATVVVDTNWDREARDTYVEVAATRLRRLEIARDEL